MSRVYKHKYDPLVMSASRVELMDECNAKHWYRYFGGFKFQNPSQVVGDRGHLIAQRYIDTGEQPDLTEVMTYTNDWGNEIRVLIGQVVDAGKDLLPRGVATEDDVRFTYDGITFTGMRDFFYTEIGESAHWPVPMTDMVVGDHKFTGNLKNAMSPERLKHNLAGNMYAWDAWENWAARNVDGRWIYYRTSSKEKSKTVEVRTRFERSICQDLLGKAVETSKKIHLQIFDRPDVKDVDHNFDACDNNYGGCPHRGVRCSMTSAQLLRSKNMNQRSILERTQQLAGQVPPAPPPPPPPPQAPGAPTAQLSPFWTPGEPMNVAQSYLHGQGKPLSVVALAADNGRVPPAEIASTFDIPGAWPTVGQNSPAVPPPPPPPAPVGVPTPGVGISNPPEAPAVSSPLPPAPPAPPSAEVAPGPDVPGASLHPGRRAFDLEGADRDVLKSWAVQAKLCEPSWRAGEKTLRDLLRSYEYGADFVAAHATEAQALADRMASAGADIATRALAAPAEASDNDAGALFERLVVAVEGILITLRGGK